MLATLLLASEMVSGVPANPEPFNLTQPDNSSFQARQVGDERAAAYRSGRKQAVR